MKDRYIGEKDFVCGNKNGHVIPLVTDDYVGECVSRTHINPRVSGEVLVYILYRPKKVYRIAKVSYPIFCVKLVAGSGPAVTHETNLM